MQWYCYPLYVILLYKGRYYVLNIIFSPKGLFPILINRGEVFLKSLKREKRHLRSAVFRIIILGEHHSPSPIGLFLLCSDTVASATEVKS